mgnify:CR=1 FL=1
MSGRHIQRSVTLVLLSLILFSCRDEEGEEALLPIAQKALTDTASMYYIDADSYPQDISGLPIGVLD